LGKERGFRVKSDKKIIYFDGVCNLCNGLVDFIIKRDKRKIFRFASLQSKNGIAVIEYLGLSTEKLSTVILQENGFYLTKAKAAIRIFELLPFPYNLIKVFKIFPLKLNNLIYDFIAKSRYKFFGKRSTCRMPTEEERNLFI
jgi:predicted DCC family thiol-disulfide oxidoreductase YuxK